MAARRARGPAFLPHVVSSAVEHPAVLHHLALLQSQGLLSYTLVPVDPAGRVRVGDVAAAITEATVLLSLMHANNEVGAVQPVAEAAAAAAARGVLVHCDAAQSLGKVEVDVRRLGVDMLTIVSGWACLCVCVRKGRGGGGGGGCGGREDVCVCGRGGERDGGFP
jgi:cysteine desulfurase